MKDAMNVASYEFLYILYYRNVVVSFSHLNKIYIQVLPTFNRPLN